MIIDLVRHASTGRRGHFDGRTDPPLIASAAEAVRDAHRGIAWTHVISSPLQRARDTATLMATGHALPVSVDEDWAECHFGDWEGRHHQEIAAHDAGAALAAFHRDPLNAAPPNAESWPAFESRLRRALQALLTQDPSKGPVLVISHAGAIRMAISVACGFPWPSLWALRLDYGTRVRLDVHLSDDGLWGELLEVSQPCAD